MAVLIPEKISRWEYLSDFLGFLLSRRFILVPKVGRKAKVVDPQRQTSVLFVGPGRKAHVNHRLVWCKQIHS